jgi:hypothetical protein
VALLGFVVNMKPSEPYLALYLNATKGFDDETQATKIFPWSYAGTFGLLLPFGLAAEVVGCRPVILVGLLCREATRILLLFGSSVADMALMQVAYGAGAAADAVYFAYVYTVAPSPEWHASLTAAVLGGYHAGNVLGSLLAAALVNWLVPSWRADVTPLFYLSWLSCTLGLCAFALLPPPRRALEPSLARHLLRDGVGRTCRLIGSLWASTASLVWLLWWALAASANLLVLGYFQLQLLAVSPNAPFGLMEVRTHGHHAPILAPRPARSLARQRTSAAELACCR